jgi:signal peptidase I
MSLEMQTRGDSSSDDQDSGWQESVKIVLQALALALVVRIFLYQPFNIPSGSMKETLLVGDYLFVSKLSYGYSRYSFPFGSTLFGSPKFSGRMFASLPKRGDVAVFKLPRDKTTDYIKRVIGLPGDEIQMKDGVLYINKQAVPKKLVGTFYTFEDGVQTPAIPVYEETLPEGRKYRVLDAVQNGQLDNTDAFKVPAGNYFMMGDNRVLSLALDSCRWRILLAVPISSSSPARLTNRRPSVGLPPGAGRSTFVGSASSILSAETVRDVVPARRQTD